jgi:hypothetical protein
VKLGSCEECCYKIRRASGGCNRKTSLLSPECPKFFRRLPDADLPVAPAKLERHILTVTDNRGFVSEFLAYLRVRKWLWLFPIVVIGVLLILMAALLFGPDVALKTLYQIF